MIGEPFFMPDNLSNHARWKLKHPERAKEVQRNSKRKWRMNLSPKEWAAHQRKKKSYDRVYRKRNRKRRRAYPSNSPAAKKVQNKKQRQKDLPKTRQRQASYYQNNKDSVLKQHADYLRRRCATDPGFRMMKRCGTRVREMLRGLTKSDRTKTLVGCTPETLRAYIEAQFTAGQSWESRGYRGWHLDHVVPVAAFDLTNRDHQLLCCNYRNLQPLDYLKNRAKWHTPPPDSMERLERIASALGIDFSLHRPWFEERLAPPAN